MSPAITFTPHQLDYARNCLPRLASEPMVSMVWNIPVATVRQWRQNGTGPEYKTTAKGQIIYSRNSVLAFMHRHAGKETSD